MEATERFRLMMINGRDHYASIKSLGLLHITTNHLSRCFRYTYSITGSISIRNFGKMFVGLGIQLASAERE